MLIVKGVNVFPSAIQDVVSGFEPRTTGILRIVADFPGHTTQRPLRIRVEHGEALTDEQRTVTRSRSRRNLPWRRRVSCSFFSGRRSR